MITHGSIAPEQCTAIDTATSYWPGSINTMGLYGLHTGKYHSTTSFYIEARDQYGNLMDGTGNGRTGAPLQEIQVLEIKIQGGGMNSKLQGTFTLSYQDQITQALPFNAGIKMVEHALEALLSVGSVTVDTNDVQTLVGIGIVSVIKGASILTTSVDFSSIFITGDWIRVGSTTGPVYSILSVTSTSIVLSSPYFGSTSSSLNVYQQASSQTGYTYQIQFNSDLGDLPALDIDVSKLSVTTTGTVDIKLTSCDGYRVQQIQTTSSSSLSGFFTLEYRGQQTSLLPWNVASNVLEDALESLDMIYTVTVQTPIPGLNGGFTWIITLTSIEQDDSPLDLLYAEGYQLVGTHAKIAVQTICPFTTTANGILYSQAGQMHLYLN